MASRVVLLVFGVACVLGAPTSEPYDTIVVGLGSAGTTAASILARAGKRVLALEAQDYIGGRVRTVPFGDGLVEVGAEWIHGTKNSRVYDLAMENNITVLTQDFDVEIFRSDGTTTDTELMKELTLYCLAINESSSDEPESLGRLITRKVNKYLQENHPEVLERQEFLDSFFHFMNLFINNYVASNDWDYVSANTKYEDLDGHLHTSWHRYGYKTFFELLLNRYNDGPGLPTLEIKLNTVVTKITWPQDPKENVVVTTKNGATYSANKVIVTVSLGVLKESYITLFSPGLPQEKIRAIENLSMGLLDKIILEFPQKWWDAESYDFFWSKHDLDSVPEDEKWTTTIGGTSTPKANNKSITLWNFGDQAKLMETLPEDVVKRKATELLRRFIGHKYTIPEPTDMIRSKWFSNPYTRGSYTYDNLEVAKYPNARSDLAAPLLDSSMKPRVLFAGEATNEIHFSTVHGASETGYREAMRLLPSTSKI